jgi:hypothetical protein
MLNVSISEALCSISDGHYTESDNCPVSDDKKMRRALTRCVSHMKKKETHAK